VAEAIISPQFSDRINQISLKSFAPAGKMDRIDKLNKKILRILQILSK
jgi:hypothetical protein